MSGPPPGYNPGDSLLQGGTTATIHPVMGGGGALPAGFENQSLLRGGETVPIDPVQGGGAVVPAPLKIEPGALSIPADGTLPEGFDEKLEASRGELAKLAGDYIMNQRLLWNRYTPAGGKAPTNPRIMTTDRCVVAGRERLDDTKGVLGVDRLALYLPKDTKDIILFPPVKSSRRKFYACLDYLRRLDILDSELNVKSPPAGPPKVILFAPPFLKLEGEIDKFLLSNQKIFAHFLKLKATYPNMHILTQVTEMNKMIGYCLSDYTPPVDQLDKTKPVLNLLEPTYVIFPYVRTVDEETTQGTIEKRNLGGLVFSAAAVGEPTVPASNLPSQLASPSTYFQKGGRQPISYLPNLKAKDGRILKMYDSNDVRFYGDGATVMEETTVVHYIVKQSIKEQVEEANKQTDTNKGFEPASENDLELEGVTYVRVPLAGRIYSFRNPGVEGQLVKNNWTRGLFTKDEADFLNELQIRPSFLTEIFKGEGEPPAPEQLANFMENMTISRCFTDERMLTHNECQASRNFVNRVYTYYLMHDERLRALQDYEEAAKKRLLELRAKTAEQIANEAEDAKRSAQGSLQSQLDKLKKIAENVGVDINTAPEEFEKNPLTATYDLSGNKIPREGGKIEPHVAGNTALFKDPQLSTKNPNEYSMQVIVFQRKTGYFWVGTLGYQIPSLPPPATETDADRMKRAVRAGKDEIHKINREYPGYYVVRDFN